MADRWRTGKRVTGGKNQRTRDLKGIRDTLVTTQPLTKACSVMRKPNSAVPEHGQLVSRLTVTQRRSLTRLLAFFPHVAIGLV